METKVKKPVAKIVGKDGNVFNLISICRVALANQEQQSKEMTEKVMQAGSYDEALIIMSEYCELK